MDKLSEPAVTLKQAAPKVALVTLNRPAVLNAINAEMADRLGAIVRDTEANPTTSVIILTGTGKAFCAGADIKEMASGKIGALRTAGEGFAGFAQAKRKKPWIGAINGLAFGGGSELALSCDMLIASETALFGLPEVKLGGAAIGSGLYRLPRAIPRPIALEMIATGDPIDALRAARLGMLNDVVSPECLLSAAIALALRIAKNAPLSVQESLSIARRVGDANEEELEALGQSAGAHLALTEDYREGLSAFIEKRPPIWTGR